MLLLQVPSGHHHAVTALALSADGAYAVTAGLDRAVKVWDYHLRPGNNCQTFVGLSEPARAVAFSRDCRQLLIAGEAIHAWDFNGRPVAPGRSAAAADYDDGDDVRERAARLLARAGVRDEHRDHGGSSGGGGHDNDEDDSDAAFMSRSADRVLGRSRDHSTSTHPRPASAHPAVTPRSKMHSSAPAPVPAPTPPAFTNHTFDITIDDVDESEAAAAAEAAAPAAQPELVFVQPV